MKLNTPLSILTILLLFFNVMFAQQNEDEFCATPQDLTFGDQNIFSGETDKAVLNGMEPVVINIFYWQVKGPHGEYNDILFQERKVLESVAFLNHTFNEYKIFFKYKGYDSFDSPADLPLKTREEVQSDEDENGDGVVDENDVVLDCVTQPGFDPDGYANLGRCQWSGVFSYANANGYRNTEALNVYVPYATSQGFGGAAYGIGSKQNTVAYHKMTSFNFAHEIGHNLNLYHTRSNKNGNPIHWENVTRDPFLLNGQVNEEFNALVKADQLVETAANLGFWQYDPTGQDYYPTLEGCNYVGNEVDNTGRDYEIDYATLTNCMANAYECMQIEFENGNIHFTDDQGIRMYERATSNSWADIRTTVAALYEPFAGEYYNVGPSGSQYTTYFQPGFSYKFVRCEGPYSQPAPYDDYFTYDSNDVLLYKSGDLPIQLYYTINHPNHSAIDIKEVNIALGYNRPQKCYDNHNRSADSGKVTKFHDGYYNYNTTTTNKSASEINDPNLVNTLENGLYKIEKEFEDGTTEQTIIQKGNN